MTRERLSAYIFLFIASLIWGVAGPIIKVTLSEFPPALFLTYRFAISAAIALFFIIKNHTHMPKSQSESISILVYGFFTTTVSLGFTFLGFDNTTVVSGALITALSPLVVAIASAIFLKEVIFQRERIGIFLAFIGTMLTVIEPLLNTKTAIDGDVLKGNLYMVVALLTGVFTAIHAKILLKKTIKPTDLTHISFIIGFITILPILVLTTNIYEIPSKLLHASLWAHAGVWYMAILSGTVAYILSHMGQKLIEASQASLFSYLLPVWSIPISVIWLGEKVDTATIIGALLIAMGVFIAEYRKPKPSLFTTKKPRHLPARRKA